jgi:tripartite-type tricarboxylate transporter receptor subunit TctC
MKARNFSRVVVVLAAVWGLALATHLSAQSYPVKPVRVVVPFAPGGGTDIQARILFKELNEQFRQTFIIDNRPGASGMIGAEAVVNAPADGYTILFTTAALAVNATLSKGTSKFDPVKDLAPIVWVSSTPLVLIVHPNVPVKSAQELIELARNKPALLNSAINVPGSTSHLAAEMFKQLAGLSFTTVPYKGGGLSMMAVLSGEVDFQFAEGLLAAPQIKAGKVRALAVSGAKRSPALPDVPTMGETVPGFAFEGFLGVVGPAGMPQDVVMRLNSAANKALQDADTRKRLVDLGLGIAGGTPGELHAHMKEQTAQMIRIAKEAGLKPLD